MFCNALKLPEPEPMATTRLRPLALHHNIPLISEKILKFGLIYVYFYIELKAIKQYLNKNLKKDFI